MFGWFMQWRAGRRARKEALERTKLLAARLRYAQDTYEGPTATGIMETVKGQIEQATDEKQKARGSAQRILSMTDKKK